MTLLFKLLLAFFLHNEVSFGVLIGPAYKADSFRQLIEKLLGLADLLLLAISLLSERIARAVAPNLLGGAFIHSMGQ